MQAHYEEYCLRHLSPCQLNTLYGGPGGIRTPVLGSFALKGLQLFLLHVIVIPVPYPTSKYDEDYKASQYNIIVHDLFISIFILPTIH